MDYRRLYEQLDRNPASRYTLTGIKPYPCEKVLAIDERESLCRKELFQSYFRIGTYWNSERFVYSFLPEREGLRLEEGLNLHVDLGGSLAPSQSYSLNYQLRYKKNQKGDQLEVHRLALNLKYKNTLLTVGKDSVKIGPSRYGNLLSSTHPPFYQLRIQNYYPYEKWGLWQYLFLFGKLLEKRQDHSAPNLLFFRLNYRPSKYLELGVNRAILYGGSGRPSYSLKDYPRLILGSEETLTGNKYDNDSYFGYDIRLDLPVRGTDSFQVYYEINATDIESPLKKGDPKKLHFPHIIFKFHDNARTYGLRLKRGPYLLNWEYTNTAKTMYIHHNYPINGFSYRNFPLGYPYGRSVEHTFILFGYQGDGVQWSAEVGYIKQPVKLPGGAKPDLYMRDVYLALEGRMRARGFWFELYFRGDMVENPNLSENPVQFRVVKGNKTFITVGLSLSADF